MGLEIERKFLVCGDEWRSLAVGVPYRQGYVATVEGRTVRVRIAGDRAYLTIKGLTVGITRREFEYSIPVEDATVMLDELCDHPLIEKNRHRIEVNGLTWEVDEFFGVNLGLVIAEIELTDPNQTITLPTWVGQEVSGDPRYFNSYLAQHPFQEWSTL